MAIPEADFICFSGGRLTTQPAHVFSNPCGLLLVNHAALHHEADVLQSSNILQRVAVTAITSAR